MAPAPDAEAVSQNMDITRDTLASYGTPILAGRDFDDRDTETTPNVMLVNEAFVRRFLPGRNPIGVPRALTFRSGSSGDIPLGTGTIVGVAGDAAYRSIRSPMQPTIYTPWRSVRSRSCSHTSTSHCARRASRRLRWPMASPPR